VVISCLGKYEIVALLGRGGMGEVYEARDPVIGRHVAIKTISPEGGYDETLRVRFEREAQYAGFLNHPNIVTIFDFGEAEGRLFIVMELLQGRDLREIIAAREPLTLAARLAIMEQTAEGLGFAHAHGFVHRDLKPANIHVLPDHTVKIMDFGLARAASSHLTHMGAVLGTPQYMAPEQVRGDRVSERSDVFSLGVVCYELLSGRRPFDADSLPSVLFQVLNETPAPVVEHVPDLPPALAAVLEKAMAKDPAARYADAGEMRDALRAVRAGLAPAEAAWAVPWPPPEPEDALDTAPGAGTVMVSPLSAATVATIAPGALPAPPAPAAPAAVAAAVTPLPVPPPAAPMGPRRGANAARLTAGFLAGGVLLALAVLVLLAVRREAARRRAAATSPAASATPEAPAVAAGSVASPPPPPATAPAAPERRPPPAARPTSRPEPSTAPRAQEAPAPAPAAPSPSLPAPEPAAPAVAPTPPPDREQEMLVRRLVKDLELALERRDATRLRALTSGSTPEAERELASGAWKDVRLSITGVDIQGSRAAVSLVWSQRDEAGAVSNSRRTLELERGVSGWRITRLPRR
jgi:hypothetical protein